MEREPAGAAAFPPWPSYSEEEIEAVAGVLRSGKPNYWSGEQGKALEREFAAAVGCRYGVAVMNGSVALELALHALGIGPGDEVVVPCRTFVATASSVVMRGARPRFADVDPRSQTLTPRTIAAAITPRTRVIIAVHLNGWPCDMDAIMDLAQTRGLQVIEDCAQAHGAVYRGRPVGGIGHVAAWSFCQDKIITTGGEGGMLTTNHPDLWRRAWSFKDHGRDRHLATTARYPPGFRWLISSFGTNWRMTEMQAAIGRVQLRKLRDWVRARQENAARLWRAFARIPGLRISLPPAGSEHACYKCYAFIRPESLMPGWDRDRVVSELNARGIPCMQGICPEVYREQAFVERFGPHPRLPVAERLGETSMMFQVHPTLRATHIDRVIAAVREVMGMAVTGKTEARA